MTAPPWVPPQPDLAVTPILEAWQACLRGALARWSRPVCRDPITYHQEHPAADACDCDCEGGGHGQAWLRWVSTAPAKAAGNTSGACSHGLFDVTVEAGVYRCWPVPELGPLPQAEEETAARDKLRDACALRKSLQCCGPFSGESWEMVESEPIGPQGGCIGTYIQARFLRYDCGCPEADTP